jgi:hypothetical protein
MKDCAAAVHRGSLGIHLDGGGQDLSTEEKISFVGRQCL